LDFGIPVTLIGEAVFARCLSSLKEERTEASKVISGPSVAFTGDKQVNSLPLSSSSLSSPLAFPHFSFSFKIFINQVRDALFASKVVSYAQGFLLMRTAAKVLPLSPLILSFLSSVTLFQEFGWNLNYGGIALMWRGGCIIRSTFLGKIKDAYDANPNLSNLLLDPYFLQKLSTGRRRNPLFFFLLLLALLLLLLLSYYSFLLISFSFQSSKLLAFSRQHSCTSWYTRSRAFDRTFIL
jgi:6-phosphogluconate dehydrogenase